MMKGVLGRPLLSRSCPRQGSIDRVGKSTRLRRTPFRRRLLCAAAPDPEQMRKMQEDMKAAMEANPQLRQKMSMMQEALKNPAVKQQVEQTMAYLQSDETRAKMEALREDPEMKEKFAEIEKGGIGALARAMNDTAFLEKVGRAVGPPPGAQAPPPPQPADAAAAPDPAPDLQMPEINTILDAAKYGDVEAVEDFLAIGKDPNLVDEFSRSPLHFAASIQHLEIIDALISAGANLELKDSKQNTPLHYAAGYGRPLAVRRLLEAGADKSATNENGKTAADVASLSEKNPILQDEELIKKLREMSS